MAGWGKKGKKGKKGGKREKRRKKEKILSASFSSHKKTMLNLLGTKISYFLPQKGREKRRERREKKKGEKRHFQKLSN